MPSPESLVGGHAAALAKSARERLARALAELQVEGAPQVCLANAGGVAKAMSLLLSYEQRLDRRCAEEALRVVRQTLGGLQAVGAVHPALARATSNVAASLGLLHSVGELANVGRDKHSIPVEKAPSTSQQFRRLHGTPSLAADATDTAKAGRPDNRRRPGSPSLERRVQPWEEIRAPDLLRHGKSRTRATGKAQRDRGAHRPKPIEAALGTHSHTNFYRGLGDDIFESGGLFVATYEIPPRGQTVVLKVNMPGGYEFEAEGVVRWTRELTPSSSDVPEVSPGFGVQFTSMTTDARRLVERYVRNREPIFHD